MQAGAGVWWWRGVLSGLDSAAAHQNERWCRVQAVIRHLCFCLHALMLMLLTGCQLHPAGMFNTYHVVPPH